MANNILVVRLAQLGTFDLRKLFYRRTLRMDLATFSEDGTADLMSRFTNDMNQVAGGLDSLFGKLIREPLKMFACLAGAAYFSWRLLLLTLIVTPVAGFPSAGWRRVLKRANRRAMEEIAVIYTTLEETFRSIKIVKAFTNERQERRRFHDNNKRYLHKAMRIASYDSLTHPMTEVLGITTISLAMIAGAWLILSRRDAPAGNPHERRAAGPGRLLTFFVMLAGMADPLRKMSDIFSNLQAAFAAADRIFSRLDREPRIRDPKTARPLPPPPPRPGVRERQLRLSARQTGPRKIEPEDCFRRNDCHRRPQRLRQNDAGQSDSAIRRSHQRRDQARRRAAAGDAAPRPPRPDRHRHARDDALRRHDLQQYPLRRPRRHARASRRGRQTGPRPPLHRAANCPTDTRRKAGALGSRLSGGQRQRIALARAILRDPAILILDEATSQVDLESEQAIQQVLEKFTRNRTTILITHRLAVLSLADRIVVMQGGRILDVGRSRRPPRPLRPLPPPLPDPLRGPEADGVSSRD